MGGEHELISRAQADVFFGVVLVLGLIGGPTAFWLARRRGNRSPGFVGLAAGGPLVLVGVLWRIYNAITDRLGLDTVLNLAVNLALFVLIGLACGFAWRRVAGKGDNGTVEPIGETGNTTETPEV